MKTTRPERRPDQTATTALLLMVLVLATTAAGTADRTVARNGLHGTTGAVSGLVNPPLVEATALPGSTLLAPPSDTMATVGTRSGSDVTIDLAHLAGTSMEAERCRRDLPPPHRAA